MTNQLPHEKGFHVSWDQLHRDSRALAWRLDGKGPNKGNWKAVIGITRGGMAPAMIVARELDIRVVDTISVKSYDHQAQSDAIVLKSPDSDLIGDGQGILIIDDLVDSILFLLNNNKTGTYNLVAPNPISSKLFTLEISKVLNKKILLPPIPSFLLK